MEKADSKWFESWFDSPYYPVLYSHRDFNEAENFLKVLTSYLHLPAGAHVLDLACGSGRHSIALNSMGFEVTGIDLSAQSIARAKAHEGPHLHFQVADMRYFQLNQEFDAILNVFTSFGYFESKADNKTVLLQVVKHLKRGAFFVLDFFNADKVRAIAVHDGEKTSGQMHFKWQKKISDHEIIKHIEVNDAGQVFHFQERVQLFTMDELKSLVAEAGLTLIATFGSYALEDFNAENSDRAILICKL